MRHDLTYSVRLLLRHPGFTLVSTLVLGFGLGSSIALFSIVYTIFFRALPVHEPDRLVRLYWIVGQKDRRPCVMPVRDYEYFRDNRVAFAAMTAYWGTPVG